MKEEIAQLESINHLSTQIPTCRMRSKTKESSRIQNNSLSKDATPLRQAIMSLPITLTLLCLIA